jgi:hypothetical protein
MDLDKEMESLKMTEFNNNFFTRNWWNYIVDRLKKIIKNSELPYKSYCALLTQSGSAPPTAIVLENTLGYTPTFVYQNTGSYEANWSTSPSIVWNASKTMVFAGKNNTSTVGGFDSIEYFGLDEGDGRLMIASYDNAGVLSNDILSKTPIEIRVYN